MDGGNSARTGSLPPLAVRLLVKGRNHGGRPKVLDEDDVLFARALRDKGTPMPDIVKKLTIKTGKNVGQHPSIATLYRVLAETADQHERP